MRGCGFERLHPHPDPLPQGRGSCRTGSNSRFGHLNLDHWILPFDMAQGGESLDSARDPEFAERACRTGFVGAVASGRGRGCDKAPPSEVEGRWSRSALPTTDRGAQASADEVGRRLARTFVWGTRRFHGALTTKPPKGGARDPSRAFLVVECNGRARSARPTFRLLRYGLVQPTGGGKR